MYAPVQRTRPSLSQSETTSARAEARLAWLGRAWEPRANLTDGEDAAPDQSVAPVSSVRLGGARGAREQTDGDFEALSGEIASLRGEVAELRAIVGRLQTRLDPEGDVS